MPAIKRRAQARWEGSGMEGKGSLSTTSGALSNLPYSFVSRFKNEDGTSGTNPEELIGAAHAGCYSMKLSFVLGEAGFTPSLLETTSVVSLEDGAINKVELTVSAVVPGCSDAQFQAAAEDAKQNCPVSKVLNAEITLSASLKS